MPNVTIEYVILIPLLFTQVIVFPLVANTITSSWQESERNVALQEAADHLASTVQQLYLTVNREEILAGTITHALRIPATINSYPYTAMGSLSSPSDPNSTRILTLTLTMEDGTTVTALAVMGSNVIWTENPILQSNSANASLELQKFSNSTIVFSFGG
ncbi:MAG: hypothetical protein JSW14_00640 [Candidatus Bathyarchaeum sp.]|nr:MAG: hypothetical protein JSW14_00640 [Candidatus Bathyarchaeum sp.]